MSGSARVLFWRAALTSVMLEGGDFTQLLYKSLDFLTAGYDFDYSKVLSALTTRAWCCHRSGHFRHRSLVFQIKMMM
jgi:hypothetical protein